MKINNERFYKIFLATLKNKIIEKWFDDKPMDDKEDNDREISVLTTKDIKENDMFQSYYDNYNFVGNVFPAVFNKYVIDYFPIIAYYEKGNFIWCIDYYGIDQDSYVLSKLKLVTTIEEHQIYKLTSFISSDDLTFAEFNKYDIKDFEKWKLILDEILIESI